MKILRKISLFAIIAITLFMSVYTQSFAYAEETSYDYDTSSVIADLNGGEEKPENEFFPERYLRNILLVSIQTSIFYKTKGLLSSVNKLFPDGEPVGGVFSISPHSTTIAADGLNNSYNACQKTHNFHRDKMHILLRRAVL